MFGIKTRIIRKVRSFISTTIPSDTFPISGVSKLLIYCNLFFIKKEYDKKGQYNNLGWLTTPARPLAVWAYKFFLDVNPNHLGNWTIKRSTPFGTQILERDVIKKMINLYHGNHNALEGYITSGGTEGNLFSMWMGRNYLKSKIQQKYSICVIQTDLTHYSITKCADITGINLFTTPLNSKTWNMDPEGLFILIQKLYTIGYRGFLIPLTLGYTQTGTSDDKKAIATIIKKIKNKYKDIYFFLWMDAALNGLIEPFLNNTFRPFTNPYIQTLLVDFHKFAGVPHPAGVILYKKKFRPYIERTINYLPETDATVLGSRPGASAVSIWATICSLGKYGFKKIIQDQLTNKQLFLKNLNAIYPNIKIITERNSLTCGLVIPNSIYTNILKQILKKYGFFAKTHKYTFEKSNKQKVKLYKIYFLPHMTTHIIYNIFRQIESYHS